jgi:hypothetical protein
VLAIAVAAYGVGFDRPRQLIYRPAEIHHPKQFQEREVMAGEIDARLAELGIELPEAPAPVASYVPYTVSGKLVFLSGQINI